MLLYAPTAGFSRLGNYIKCEYFKTVNLGCGIKKQESLIRRCRKRDILSPPRVGQLGKNICIDTDSALGGFLESLIGGFDKT